MAAALLVILAMVVLGEYTATRGRLFLTAVTLGGFSVAGLGAAAWYDRAGRQLLPSLAMLASLLGFALVALGIWATPDSDAFWKAAGVVSILAVSAGQSCFLLSTQGRRPLARRLLYPAVAAVSLLASLLILAIMLELRSRFFWWPVVLLALADGLTTLAAIAVAGTPPGPPRSV